MKFIVKRAKFKRTAIAQIGGHSGSIQVALLVYEPDFSELHAILNRLRPDDQLDRYGSYCGLPNVKNIYVMYLIVVICSISISSYTIMITAGLKVSCSS